MYMIYGFFSSRKRFCVLEKGNVPSQDLQYDARKLQCLSEILKAVKRVTFWFEHPFLLWTCAIEMYSENISGAGAHMGATGFPRNLGHWMEKRVGGSIVC